MNTQALLRSATRSPVPRSKSLRVTMAALMLVLFIGTLDQTIVAAALGSIGQILGDAHWASWVATAYLLTSAVTTLLFGKLGDIVGRKSVLQASIAIFTLGSILCAFAPSMGWLVVFRAIQGLGGGGLSSLAMTVVGELVPARERARYQAVLGIVPALAIVLGPVLGGFIVEQLSWRWIFLINVPVGVVAIAMIAHGLNLPRYGGTRKLDLAGGLLATVFSSALLLGISGNGNAGNDPHVLYTVSLLSLVTYLVVEYKARDPITPLSLFTNRIFVSAALLFFLATAVLFVGMLYVPMMLQQVFGYSPLAAGAAILPLLLGLIVATMITGSVVSRTGRYKIFPLIGACMAGASLIALGSITPSMPGWFAVTPLITMGLGLGFFIQVSVLAGQNAVTHAELGVATGTLNFFKTMGGAVGASVLGAVLARSMAKMPEATPGYALNAYRAAFLCTSPVMAVAFLIALLMPEKPLSNEILLVAEGKVDVPEY